MNWNDLKLVLAVSEARSFQGAGRLTRQSHTTVSRRIAALEAAIGRPLFVRQHKTCLPTSECTRLVAAARRIEEELLRARSEVDLTGAQSAAVVHVLSVGWVVHRILLPEVPALRQTHPGICLNLNGTLSDEMPKTLDPVLALRFELPPDREETAIPVARVGYAVYAPADARDPETLPWVTFHGSAPLEWLGTRGVPASDVVLMASDGAAVREAVALGIGRGLIPECLARGDTRLRRLSGPEPEFVRLLRAVGKWSDVLTSDCQSVLAWIERSFLAVGCGTQAAAAR